MPSKPKFLNELSALKGKSPNGFALAYQIRLTTPSFLFQTYPSDWNKYYSEMGLVMFDPTVLWGFENDGVIKWSELADLDEKDVLIAASKFGLNFGMTWAHGTGDSRSIGSFARGDRDFSQTEMEELARLAEELHHATLDLSPISSVDVNALISAGIRVSQNLS